MGRMVLTVLGIVAEMELGFIKDRQRAGIEAAKAKGVYKGRPVTFDHAKIVALRREGMGATDIARAVGCKRGNVYKTLKAAGVAEAKRSETQPRSKSKETGRKCVSASIRHCSERSPWHVPKNKTPGPVCAALRGRFPTLK